MRLRLFLIWTCVGLCVGGAATAQERRPVGEFNVGYSLLTDFDFNGHGFNVGVIGNPSKWFGIEGQFDAWYNVGSSGVDIYSTVAGPRLAYRTRSVTPFVHALFGATYGRFAGHTSTDFVMKWGAGVDFNFGRNYAWRLEANDLVHVDPWDHTFNASTSFVFRWR